MIAMSLDVRKDYALKKIMNGILVLSIQILEQSQTYNLYLREGTISPNHFKMLTPHQGSDECSLLKIMFLYIRETNLQFLKKGVLSTTQYEDISRAANLEESMNIYHIFLQSHCQVKILSN